MTTYHLHRDRTCEYLMRRITLIGFLMAAVPAVAAQTPDVFLAGQRAPMHITLAPLYQSFEHGGQSIGELTFPLAVYVPLRRNWGVGVRAAWAEMSGDELTTTSGATDAQVYASHYRSVGRGSVVATLGINVPSGKQRFTRDEYRTLTRMSRNEYGFRTPSFGLGAGVSPGMSVAYPLTDHIVVGLGAAYQFRSAFEPLENMIDPYRPGDELLLTGGVDLRLRSTLSFSIDLTYTSYRPDRVGNRRVLEAGDKIVAGAQLRYTGLHHSLRLYGQYRSRARNSIAVAGGDLIDEPAKSFPDQMEIYVTYRTNLSRALSASLMGELRHFDMGPVLSNLREMYGAGLGLELALSRHLRAPARFLYRFGDVTGIEAALGLNLRL